MLAVYRILLSLLLLISPIILIYRILKGKEDPKRFHEKFGFFPGKKTKKKLIWFHGSSVGEILSIIPIIEKIESEKKNIQILITSNTVSSSKVLKKFKFRNVHHQFLPIDHSFIIDKFLNYWKPHMVIFIESEIWPNLVNKINERKIPLVLLNARITKKTYNNWKFFSGFANDIFRKFDLCLCQNNETKYFLNKLGAKNIKKYGNLKFVESKFRKSQSLEGKTINFLKRKKIIFGGFSTHNTEEEFCVNIHMGLKKNNPGILTIIVPRHINRINEIIDEFKKHDIEFHRHSIKSKIKENTEIYLVDTFGESEFFMKYCKIVFLGGSLIKHGGQNPIEAARNGCFIIHGSNINNFKEVYDLLKKCKISSKINSQSETIKIIKRIRKSNRTSNSVKLRLKIIGNKILKKNFIEINRLLK